MFIVITKAPSFPILNVECWIYSSSILDKMTKSHINYALACYFANATKESIYHTKQHEGRMLTLDKERCYKQGEVDVAAPALAIKGLKILTLVLANPGAGPVDRV